MPEEYIPVEDIPKEQRREKRKRFIANVKSKVQSFGKGVKTAAVKTGETISKVKGGVDRGIEKYSQARKTALRTPPQATRQPARRVSPQSSVFGSSMFSNAGSSSSAFKGSNMFGNMKSTSAFKGSSIFGPPIKYKRHKRR